MVMSLEQEQNNTDTGKLRISRWEHRVIVLETGLQDGLFPLAY